MEINTAELQKAAAASNDNAPELMGADILIKTLQAEGVEFIWGYPGGAALYIYDAIYRQDSIQHILVRHEQAAVHAADGYARSTDKVGVALVTSGPGVTNAMTGIANAFRAESPLVMIGGQGALSQHKMGSLQDLPHVDIMSPITKFAASVPHTAPQPAAPTRKPSVCELPSKASCTTAGMSVL